MAIKFLNYAWRLIVSIVTPLDLHSPMTMAALHRGIHVLYEKPFALNLDEAWPRLTQLEVRLST